MTNIFTKVHEQNPRFLTVLVSSNHTKEIILEIDARHPAIMHFKLDFLRLQEAENCVRFIKLENGNNQV